MKFSNYNQGKLNLVDRGMGVKRLLAAPHEEAVGVSVRLAHSGDRLPASGRDREQTCNNAAEAYEIQKWHIPDAR